MKRAGRFLNVDLDVTSDRSLARLGMAFEALGAIVLHCGRIGEEFVLTIEADFLSRRRPPGVIAELCRLVEALPPAAQKILGVGKNQDLRYRLGGCPRNNDHLDRCSAKPPSARRQLERFNRRVGLSTVQPIEIGGTTGRDKGCQSSEITSN